MKSLMLRSLSIAILIGGAQAQTPAPAQPAAAPGQAAPAQARPPRPPAPARDPHTPGYVTAKELPDGAVPSPKEDGNFILGTTHNPAPETVVQENVPQGTIFNFTMESTDSKFYPGI